MEPVDPSQQSAQPQQPQQPSPAPVPKTDLHSMVVMQPGESLVCEIKRHPFGIVSLYASVTVAIFAALILAVVFVPKLSDVNAGSGNLQMIALAILGLFVLGAAVLTAIATSVYWQNRWIVTSDSLTQITQSSLFGRQSSQLSLENLEDVTVDQNGILQHMFNFGTLRVETAGEHSKFVFPYCPHPTVYARQILAAREEFMRHEQYNASPQPEVNLRSST